MDVTYFLKTFAALFAIMSPIANLPVFLSLTSDRTAPERRRIALVATVGLVVGGAVVLVAGEGLLKLFGLEIDHFRLAGGLLILLIALNMVNGSKSVSHHGTSAEQSHHATVDDPSIYPLTVPMLLGPGTISTLIILQHGGQETSQKVAVWAALGAQIALLCGTFLLAGKLSSLLGESATSVMARLMGMILAAIGLEMMVASLSSLLPGLAG